MSEKKRLLEITIAAEQGSEIYGDNTDRSSGSPDGDTLLHYIKTCDREDILRRFHNSTDLMLNRAKQHLEFDRPANIGVDYTDIAYYGKKRESKWVWDRRGFDGKDHDWAFRFASVSIVGDNVQFVLGVLPVPGGMGHGAVMEELLELARSRVSIGTVYADRSFATSDVIRCLNERPVEYIIPVSKNARIKRKVERMRHEVEVEKNYGIYGKQRGGATNERAETTLALVPASRSDANVASVYRNKDVDDSGTLDRKRTGRVINRYRRRWGVETQYRSLKTFLPWTTSNNHVVRLFHFAFGMLMYNLWRLIDFLVQQSLDKHETRYKPRLKAKRFINAMENRRLLG